MAHFYVTGIGRGNETSRCGTKNSGIKSDTNGWEEGIRVIGEYNEKTKEDEFTIFLNGGSNNSHESIQLAQISGGKIKTLSGLEIPIKDYNKFLTSIKTELITVNLLKEVEDK